MWPLIRALDGRIRDSDAKTDQQTARVRKIRRFQVLRPGDIIYRVEQATDEEFCGAIDRYPNAVLPVGQRGEFQ